MEDYRSVWLRKAQVQHAAVGGVKAFCLALYAQGCTYMQIAERVNVPIGTLGRHLAKWRKEANGN